MRRKDVREIVYQAYVTCTELFGTYVSFLTYQPLNMNESNQRVVVSEDISHGSL